jgi:hypothetical protein
MDKKILSDYSFSCDHPWYPFQEMLEADFLANQFFHTENDPTQLRIDKKNDVKIYKKFAACENIISYKDNVIGETFVLPCTKKYMQLFLDNKINEAQLFEHIINEVTYENFDCIYLCLMYILPEHQGKWLATHGRLKTLHPLVKNKKNIILFVRW